MSKLVNISTRSIQKVQMNLVFNDNVRKVVILEEGNTYKIEYMKFPSDRISTELTGKLVNITEISLYGFNMSHGGKTYNLLFDPADDNVEGGQIWISTLQLTNIELKSTSNIGGGNIDGSGTISESTIIEAVNLYMAQNPVQNGVTPKISIGTVTTLEAGSEATVTITGTPENPVLNLGIPKGANGAAGKDGKDGAAGKDGENGEDGAAGKDGENGKDGYTPVKGTDYWTEADKLEMKTYCENYINTQIGGVLNASY